MVKKRKYEFENTSFDKKHDVLKNKLGITDRERLELVEKEHLINAYRTAGIYYPKDHSFTAQDICYLHKLFLGEIYEWAGIYRIVDLSSEDIRFCHAAYIKENMETYSADLKNLTPFASDLPRKEMLEKLALIHGELIIIHPFRDGNGRTTRLLCDLLLMQAEYRPIKAAAFYDKSFVKTYHKAIQKIWHSKNYIDLTTLFEPLVSK